MIPFTKLGIDILIHGHQPWAFPYSTFDNYTKNNGRKILRINVDVSRDKTSSDGYHYGGDILSDSSHNNRKNWAYVYITADADDVSIKAMGQRMGKEYVIHDMKGGTIDSLKFVLKADAQPDAHHLRTVEVPLGEYFQLGNTNTNTVKPAIKAMGIQIQEGATKIIDLKRRLANLKGVNGHMH